MEQLYRDPHTLLRMREGPLGADVDEFARQLSNEGDGRPSCRQARHPRSVERRCGPIGSALAKRRACWRRIQPNLVTA